MRFEYDAVAVEDAQRGRYDRPQVRLPPGGRVGGARPAGCPRSPPPARRRAAGSRRAAAGRAVRRGRGRRVPRRRSPPCGSRGRSARRPGRSTPRRPRSPPYPSCASFSRSWRHRRRMSLVMRTSRLNLRNRSCSGAYSVRIAAVGQVSKAVVPSRTRRPSAKASARSRRSSCQGCAGSSAIAGRGLAQGVERRGVTVLDDRVRAHSEQHQREAGVCLGGVRQPAGHRTAAACLGGGVVGVAGDEGLLGAPVRVLRDRRQGAGGEQRGHRVAAVDHLGGQLVVGQARVAAQFLGDEFDEFGVADGVPVRPPRTPRALGRPPLAAHTQQAVDAGQPVGAVGAPRRDGLRDLAQQAVEERRGRVRVGVRHLAGGGMRSTRSTRSLRSVRAEAISMSVDHPAFVARR